MGWPDIIGVTDASQYGVGGIVIGEQTGIPPTVFCLPWPEDIRNTLVSTSNPGGSLMNSDLKMAALLLLFLIIEAVGGSEGKTHSAL
jgi:hypothetical protein